MPRTAVPTKYVPKPGSIARFAPAGRTIETVEVSKANKPAGAVFTDWVELGCIETGSVELLTDAGEPVYCFNAATGRDELLQTEMTDADTRLRIKAVLQEVTDYLWQLALAAKSVHPDTGVFVPGSLPGGAVQGWLKIQIQISATVVSVMDLWVEMRLSNEAKIRDRTSGYKPEVELTQLGAPGETGVLGTPAS